MNIAIRSWAEMDRWIPGGPSIADSAYSMVPLSELLIERREKVSAKEFFKFTPITIHFDGSIEKRKRDQPFKGQMWAAHPGDVVFSKIDVRNGAIAIVPEALGQIVVTSEYPTYIPDKTQVDPRFLAFLLRSPNFLHILRSIASGTSGRKRISPDTFGQIEIPLPDVVEQCALIDALEAAQSDASILDEQASALISLALKQFEADLGLAPPPNLPHRLLQIANFKDLERWSHEAVVHQSILGAVPPESSYEIVALEDVAEVSYGIQKSPTNRPKNHSRPYLRVANVRRGELDLREIKKIDVKDAAMASLRLETGDILFVEGNGSRSELGRAAMWGGEIEDCVHQNHIIKARPDKAKVSSEFLMEWFNTDAGRQHFFRNAKTTSGLGTLNSTDIRTAPVPLPPSVELQKEIVQKLRLARGKAGKLRQAAIQSRAVATATFLAAIFH